MEGTTGTISVEQITQGITDVFKIMSSVLNQITANPLFLMFFVMGLIYAAVNVIKALKHA